LRTITESPHASWKAYRTIYPTGILFSRDGRKVLFTQTDRREMRTRSTKGGALGSVRFTTDTLS
jgi:hypothetical protein